MAHAPLMLLLLSIPAVLCMASVSHEATYWADKVNSKRVAVGPPRRPAAPVYEFDEWWEGEELHVSDVVADASEVEASRDPCWWNADECETAAAPLGATAPPDVSAVANLLELELPCITTDVGCTVEAKAGIIEAEEPVEAEIGSAESMDPCFWDAGCVAF